MEMAAVVHRRRYLKVRHDGDKANIYVTFFAISPLTPQSWSVFPWCGYHHVAKILLVGLIRTFLLAWEANFKMLLVTLGPNSSRVTKKKESLKDVPD